MLSSTKPTSNRIRQSIKLIIESYLRLNDIAFAEVNVGKKESLMTVYLNNKPYTLAIITSGQYDIKEHMFKFSLQNTQSNALKIDYIAAVGWGIDKISDNLYKTHFIPHFIKYNIIENESTIMIKQNENLSLKDIGKKNIFLSNECQLLKAPNPNLKLISIISDNNNKVAIE